MLIFRFMANYSGTGSETDDGLAHFRFMEVLKKLISGVYKALECFCLQLATGYDINRTLNIAHQAGHENISVGSY